MLAYELGTLGQASLSGACRDTVIGNASVTNKHPQQRIIIIFLQFQDCKFKIATTLEAASNVT